MWQQPAVGQRLRVVTRHTNSWIGSKDQYRYNEYVGEVLPSNRWDPPGTFKLLTRRPEFPESVIALSNVVEMAAPNGALLAKTAVQQAKTVNIDNGKGSVYTVIFDGSRWRCNCPGFEFRKNCRHLKLAEAA